MISSAFTRLLYGVMLATAVSLLDGQQTVNTASVSGRVTDPSGATVEDAQVTARELDTGISTVVDTGRDGRFRFPYLKVGRYAISVHHPAFADVSEPLNLTVGSAFELPISLQIATRTTDITVGGQAAMLETARSEITGTIGEPEINRLPLNGRSFLDIALLVPGVSPTNTAANQLFAETSAAPGQGISINSHATSRTALSWMGFLIMTTQQD